MAHQSPLLIRFPADAINPRLAQGDRAVVVVYFIVASMDHRDLDIRQPAVLDGLPRGLVSRNHGAYDLPDGPAVRIHGAAPVEEDFEGSMALRGTEAHIVFDAALQRFFGVLDVEPGCGSVVHGVSLSKMTLHEAGLVIPASASSFFEPPGDGLTRTGTLDSGGRLG